MAVVLIIKTEDGNITELPVLNKVVLGRSSSSDYKISDSKMSGNHCSFELTPKGELLFSDLGSSNGSYINNSQIFKTLVRINDIIRVGNTLIKIDDRKLTTPERLTIGSTAINNSKASKDKTLPTLPPQRPDKQAAKKETPPAKAQEDEASPKKKTIMRNKEIKEKKRPVNTWINIADTVLEQEESTGHTKFLKLDKNKGKKK